MKLKFFLNIVFFTELSRIEVLCELVIFGIISFTFFLQIIIFSVNFLFNDHALKTNFSTLNSQILQIFSAKFNASLTKVPRNQSIHFKRCGRYVLKQLFHRYSPLILQYSLTRPWPGEKWSINSLGLIFLLLSLAFFGRGKLNIQCIAVHNKVLKTS